MTAKPAFVVTFEPKPGGDGLLGLRAVLEYARRAHGLKCVALRIESPDAAPALPSGAAKPGPEAICGAGEQRRQTVG